MQSSRDEVVVVVYGHVAAASVVVADEIASTTLVLGDTILDRLSFHRRRTSDNPSWLSDLRWQNCGRLRNDDDTASSCQPQRNDV